LLQAARPVTLEAIQEALRDHTTAPRNICRHWDKEAPIAEQARTVTSVIIDLHDGVLQLSDGPPCTNDYTTYALGGKRPGPETEQ
jgi:isopenicillin-N N-acyltransferase-like protein